MMDFNDMVRKQRNKFIKKDYNDDWEAFVGELPENFAGNGYNLLFNSSDSDFITYVHNGDCGLELTIFPGEDVHRGTFTIEKFVMSKMDWTMVYDGDYNGTDDLISQVNDRINALPQGS